MSPESTGFGSPLLDGLNRLMTAVTQIRLYPPSSSRVRQAASAVCDFVDGGLSEDGTLTVAGTERGFVMNGRDVPAEGAVSAGLQTSFLGFLRDAGVASITFRKGVTIDEMITFLSALVKKFWDLRGEAAINRRLGEDRVSRISIGGIPFVAVPVAPPARETIRETVRETGRMTRRLEPKGPLDALIAAVTDASLGPAERLQILDKLLEQDPTLLQRAGGAGAEAASGGPRPVEGQLPFEQARLLLSDLAWLASISPPDTGIVLRRIGISLADAFRQSAPHAAMLRGYLGVESSRAIPTPDLGPPSAATRAADAIYRATALLIPQSDAEIRSFGRDGAARLKELDALGRADLSERVLSSLAKGLADRSASRRRVIGDALFALRPALEVKGREVVCEQTEDRLRAAIDTERDADAYRAQAGLLLALADGRARQGDVGRAEELLVPLRKHAGARDPDFPTRAEIASRTLDRVASSGTFAALAEQLRAAGSSPVGIASAERPEDTMEEADLRRAREVQEKLVPRDLPDLPGWEAAHAYIPASNVGGDCLDAFPLDGERAGFVVGDVSGKGVSGAMVMVMVRSAFRTAAAAHPTPAATVAAVNRQVRADIKPGMFVSVIYACLHLPTGELTLVNCGHNPPVVRESGTFRARLLGTRGMPLGVAGPERFDTALREESIRFGPGDRILLYTDGVVEAMNEREEEFGEEAFLRIVNERGAQPSRAVVDAVIAALADHRGGAAPSDDITLLDLRRRSS
jgi:serine phosphatase RsbU (regulator of sigma subunit)